MFQINKTSVKGKRAKKVQELTDLLDITKVYSELSIFHQPIKIRKYFDNIQKLLDLVLYTPNAGYLAILVDDITKSKKIEQINNARAQILEFSISHDSKETLQKVIDETEFLTKSSIGFFHFFDSNETIKLQVWSTRTLNEFCSAEGHGLHYPLEKAGIWADCIRKRAPLICEYKALSSHNFLPTGHAEVKRFLSIPIFRNNRVVAIIGVGNKETRYTQEDVNIVSELADLTWEIIEHKKDEEEMERKDAQFCAMLNNSLSPIFIIDKNYCYSAINVKHKKIMKNLYNVDVEVGKNFLKCFSNPFDREAVENNIKRALNGETVIDKKNQTLLLDDSGFYITYYPIRDNKERIIGVIIASYEQTKRNVIPKNAPA